MDAMRLANYIPAILGVKQKVVQRTLHSCEFRHWVGSDYSAVVLATCKYSVLSCSQNSARVAGELFSSRLRKNSGLSLSLSSTASGRYFASSKPFVITKLTATISC